VQITEVIAITITKEDIKDRVKNRVSDIPSDLTDVMIKEFVDDAHIELEQVTGDSIDINDIDEKYRPILTNLSCLYLMCFKLDGDVSANLDLGQGVSIDYGSRAIQGFTEREVKMIEFFKERINSSLKTLGKTQNYGFSDPGVRI